MSSIHRMRQLALRCVLVGLCLTSVSVTAADPQLAEETLAPGVVYFRAEIDAPTRAVAHVLRLDRHQPGTHVTLAVAEGGTMAGCAPVTAIAKALDTDDREVVAAVNAGFFGSRCEPVGTLVSEGRLIAESDRGWVKVGLFPGLELRLDDAVDFSCRLYPAGGGAIDVRLNRSGGRGPWLLSRDFGRDSDTLPIAQAFRLDGVAAPRLTQAATTTVGAALAGSERLHIPDGGMLLGCGKTAGALLDAVTSGTRLGVRVALTDASWREAMCVVTGAGWLLDDGKPKRDAWDRFKPGFRGLHPRTIIGGNEDTLYLVVVDGRQPGYSMGMSFETMATFMRDRLGCRQAANLDGGGSSAMVVGDRVRSCPSDRAYSPCDGVERAVGNALVVVWQRD